MRAGQVWLRVKSSTYQVRKNGPYRTREIFESINAVTTLVLDTCMCGWLCEHHDLEWGIFR